MTVRRTARTIDCPRCGAAAGEPCRGPSGGRARDPHRIRTRIAHEENAR